MTDVLKLKNRDLDYTQNKINDEIKKESQKALELKDMETYISFLPMEIKIILLKRI